MGLGADQEKTRSTSTIATTFKKQLTALEQTLLATTPHYVRCVKPNKRKRPNDFDAPMILDQLLYRCALCSCLGCYLPLSCGWMHLRPQCGPTHPRLRWRCCVSSGVLETVRIRRQGFPYRETYPDYWSFCSRRGYTSMVPAAEACVVVADGKCSTAHPHWSLLVPFSVSCAPLARLPPQLLMARASSGWGSGAGHCYSTFPAGAATPESSKVAVGTFLTALIDPWVPNVLAPCCPLICVGLIPESDLRPLSCAAQIAMENGAHQSVFEGQCYGLH